MTTRLGVAAAVVGLLAVACGADPPTAPTTAGPGTSATSPVAADARLRQIGDGYGLAEGPVWWRDGLVFSDVTADTVYVLQPDGQRTVLAQPSNWANGHAVDGQGRLVQAEHGSRSVTRTEPDGSTTVLADRYEGRRFNSPNDVVVRSDGTVWFTDPTFGLTRPYGPADRTAELDVSGVYRLDPATGTVTLMTGDLNQPNGLAFSPDEQTLYVSDTGSGRTLALPLLPEGGLGPVRPFGAGYDGLRVDRDGRVWATTGSGVVVTAPDGEEVARIPTNTAPTALAWGGPDGTTLFVTTPSAVWSVATTTTGAPDLRSSTEQR